MIGWLRRWLCRCPPAEPTIQNTSYTGAAGGVEFHTFDVPVEFMPYVEPAVDQAVRRALDSDGPPTGRRERHLKLVEPLE